MATNKSSQPIPFIPPNTAPEHLIQALNDRFRKTGTAIQTAVDALNPNTVPLVPDLPRPGSIYAKDGILVDYQKHLYRWNGNLGQPELMNVQTIVGTHTARLTTDPTKLQIGTPYWEQDRDVTYIVAYDSATSKQNQWYYQSGVYRDVLGSLVGMGTALPILTAYDKGYRFDATDSIHSFVFNGSLWHFCPGDDSGYTVFGLPTKPPNGKWVASDGTTYSVVQPDGSTVSIASPNVQASLAPPLTAWYRL